MNNNAKRRDIKTLKNLEIMYGEKLIPHYLEMVDCMENKSLVNTFESVGKYQLPPNLDVKEMDIVSFHGTDSMEIMTKKSAKYLKKYYPNSYIKCFNGYHHGELYVNRPLEFITETEKIIQR